MLAGKRLLFLRLGAQAVFLLLFVSLLALAAHNRTAAADSFLRADPLAGTLLPLAARSWSAAFWPALLIALSAFVFGRFFCGWICPMGATLGAAGRVVRALAGVRRIRVAPARFIKYLLLAFIAGAAFCGLNMVFWGSPLALATRLYGLLLAPGLHAAANFLLGASEPLLRELDAAILYGLEEPHYFQTAWFIAVFWGALLVLELLAPRFWCQSLCPAGALLGLAASLAGLRRRVSSKCVSCGACVKKCPYGAINPGTFAVNSSACLLCGRCAASCAATDFGFSKPAANASLAAGRRALLAAGVAGAACAALPALGVGAPARQTVRPPGAVPEDNFLKLCLRCGECMAVCPTGALQPLAGPWTAVFSPRLDPYCGACQPECVICGHVCPSQAILPLAPSQKRWAKIGTAVIDRGTCLAWAQDRRCMVCKENCPWDAIIVMTKAGYAAPVPEVEPSRCYGCGFCQKACPKTPAAIIVGPEKALRLATPDYEAAARTAGLQLSLAAEGRRREETPAAMPPGFLE